MTTKHRRDADIQEEYETQCSKKQDNDDTDREDASDKGEETETDKDMWTRTRTRAIKKPWRFRSTHRRLAFHLCLL